MPLSELHLKTIESVEVCFCISGDNVDPDVVTSTIGITPDSSCRKGDVRTVKGASGRERKVAEISNSWIIDSRSHSKDVNDQLRDLLERLVGVEKQLLDQWHRFFVVVWKGNYLYAGGGPQYDADVIHGIARLRAGLEQDIYQIDCDDHDDEL